MPQIWVRFQVASTSTQEPPDATEHFVIGGVTSQFPKAVPYDGIWYSLKIVDSRSEKPKNNPELDEISDASQRVYQWQLVTVKKGFHEPRDWDDWPGNPDTPPKPGVLDPGKSVYVWEDTGRYSCGPDGYMYDPDGNRCPFTRGGVWQSLERGQFSATDNVVVQMLAEMPEFGLNSPHLQALRQTLNVKGIDAANAQVNQEMMRASQRYAAPDRANKIGPEADGQGEWRHHADPSAAEPPSAGAFMRFLENNFWAAQEKLLTRVENYLARDPRDIIPDGDTGSAAMFAHAIVGWGVTMTLIDGKWEAITGNSLVQEFGEWNIGQDAYQKIVIGSILDDTFVGLPRTVVFMGAGDDTFRGASVDTAGVAVYGGAGNDVFSGGVAGVAQNLVGGRGDDVFTIEAGLLFITGGVGGDTYDMQSLAGGLAIVSDFDARLGQDWMIISSGMIADFSDLLINHVVEDAGSLLIFVDDDTGGEADIILDGVTAAELQESSFFFV